MHLKCLGVISLLLIAGLLYGCGDSKQPRIVDFREKNYPADVLSVSGISGHEPGGRWTIGDRAVVRFTKPLPSAFQLKLQIFRAFGPNEGTPILVKAGTIQKEFIVINYNQSILLDFERVANADRIEFVIPKPASPKDLGTGDDTRMLGLFLVSLALGPQGGK
jgi:phosphoglycerol transferase